MNNTLRKFQARDLYQNIDAWLDSKLDTATLTLRYQATGPIDVWFNGQLVSTAQQDTLTVDHAPINTLILNVKYNHCVKLTVDNFDFLPLLVYDNRKGQVVFNKPIALWYNEQVSNTRSDKVLLDSILYKEKADELEQKLVQELAKLKY